MSRFYDGLQTITTPRTSESHLLDGCWVLKRTLPNAWVGGTILIIIQLN